MLDIEGRLDNIAAGVDEGSEGQQHDLNLSQTQESVLRESRTGLEQVKDAIIEYIASQWDQTQDRKSTRLNSSHVAISYAVFCLKKKRTDKHEYGKYICCLSQYFI